MANSESPQMIRQQARAFVEKAKELRAKGEFTAANEYDLLADNYILLAKEIEKRVSA